MEIAKKTIADATKAGVATVLGLWLWSVNARVNTLEQQLYKCMEGKSITVNDNMRKNNPETIKLLAILPKEIKIKKK